MNTSIHVDCDSLWVYAAEYGVDPDYASCDVYRLSLPRIMQELDRRGLKATFFVIGRDLQLPACVEFCRRALAAGHQLGNHTYSHLEDLHEATPEVRTREITACHQAILDATGHTCRGIRFPGYYFDDCVLETLTRLGYTYDTSILPGAGVYMMSLFYLLFNRSGRNKRFGRKRYLFARRQPHRLGASALREFPIGAFPILSLPIHSTFVFQWGLAYFNAALTLARATRSHIVYLFHAIDLLEESAAGELAAKVAVFHKPLAVRKHLVGSILDKLAATRVITTEEASC